MRSSPFYQGESETRPLMSEASFNLILRILPDRLPIVFGGNTLDHTCHKGIFKRKPARPISILFCEITLLLTALDAKVGTTGIVYADLHTGCQIGGAELLKYSTNFFPRPNSI